MLGVSFWSLLFVVVIVGVSLSVMAWLLAGIPELHTRPIQLITDLDLEPDIEPEPEPEVVVDLRAGFERPIPGAFDLDGPRPTEALCP